MFRLASSSHVYFLLFETPIVPLWSSFVPKDVMWQPVQRSERKWVQSKELDIVTGHFANLCALAFGLGLHFSAHSTEEPQEMLKSCPQLQSCFIGSCHVGVLKHFSRSISLAVYYSSKTCTWSAVNFKKHVASISSKLEPAIWSCDTGQRISCIDRCQLAVT